jgi:hypothetical protein
MKWIKDICDYMFYFLNVNFTYSAYIHGFLTLSIRQYKQTCQGMSIKIVRADKIHPYMFRRRSLGVN